MRELQAYVNDALVGALREDNDIWSFQYDPGWLAREGAYALSPALPLKAEVQLDGSTLRPVQWYFDNLLPEEDMRHLAARQAGLKDAQDAFALLEYLGAESAGSLTLLSPGVAPSPVAALQPLAYETLSARIQGMSQGGLARQAPKRMSVAGAQHKLLVVAKQDDLYEPVGATASTHLLKPDHPLVQTYPASTFLEWFTMALADAAGLPVPAVALLQVPEPVYLIERFDRAVLAADLDPATGERPPQVRRSHVIDACQLLNKSRLFKRAGATPQALRDLAQATTDRLTTPVRLMRWLVFNLFVGNDDCHLKNLSFLVSEAGIALAPHYDLLATGVYHTRAFSADQAAWPHVEMAVKLGDGIAYFDQVTPAIVEQAGQALGVPPPVTRRLVQDVVTRTLRCFDQVYAVHFPDEPGLSRANASPDEDAAQASGRAAGTEVVRQPSSRAHRGPELPATQLALERRILRVLRHIVLPEMARRLIV